MPELPEVETIARRLQSVITGKQIQSLNIHHPKSFVGNVAHIEGSTITDVARQAKIITIHLTGTHSLLVHLKMTGQLIYQDESGRVGGGHPTADWVQTLPSKHTRVSLGLSGGAQLYFNDMRLFGWIKAMTPDEAAVELARYGPDVNAPEMTLEYFSQGLARKNAPVKTAIMDAQWLAGVGNIYANDALFLAKIDPRRAASSLNLSEISTLYDELQSVIQLGIETGGATISHYHNIDGFAGKYQDHLQVYQREGLPCLRCGTALIRIKQGGRSSFLCPSCQK